MKVFSQAITHQVDKIISKEFALGDRGHALQAIVEAF